VSALSCLVILDYNGSLFFNLKKRKYNEIWNECEEEAGNETNVDTATIDDFMEFYFNQESSTSRLNYLEGDGAERPRVEPAANATRARKLNLIELKMNYKDFCGSQELNSLSSGVNGGGASKKRLLNRSKSGNVKLNENGAFFLSADLSSTTSSSTTSSSSSSTSSSSILSSSNGLHQQQQVSQTTGQQHETYNFYNSSLISDYRLTLTDLMELNLIDISNGLIINPLNGARLTIADAMRIDLLNSDVREVANTFLMAAAVALPSPSPPASSSTDMFALKSLKLTVKEAIQFSILNPNRNEILLSPQTPRTTSSSSSVHVNLYEAKKKNLILKPLTLSEAFIRNLIQPNGFVRNPINNKYYAFESLILNDLNQKDRSLSGEQAICLFDLDTKHIIDPNDAEKRLLSLSEAIEMELILPRTFELNLASRGCKSRTATLAASAAATADGRINLYDAFFNSNQLNLSLLLYKPEIENVYVKLVGADAKQQQKIGVLLSKREKIGLAEAMNLNVVSLKHDTYSPVGASSCTELSLDEAVDKYKLIDAQLLDLLNTPIANNNVQQRAANRPITIRDCINDSSLQLDKHLYKNPFSSSSDVVNLDSHACKLLLGEETVKRIKRLITRINIKSYIISLNATASSKQQLSSIAEPINPPTVVYNTLSNSISSSKTLSRPIGPDLITSSYYFCDDLKSNGISSSSSNPKLRPTSALDKIKQSPQQLRQQTSIANNILTESRTYVLEYVLDANCEYRQKLSIQEAKKAGILNVEKGFYFNPTNGVVISIEEAIYLGLIGARVASCQKKLFDLESAAPPVAAGNNNSSRLRNHESTTLAIESVVDASSGQSYAISDAVRRGLLDSATLSYRNTQTGVCMTLNEAFTQGFVKGQVYANEASDRVVNELLSSQQTSKQHEQLVRGVNSCDYVFSHASDGKSMLVESEEKCLRITSVFNPVTKAYVSLDEAIRQKLFDRATGIYTEPVSGRRMNLNEATLSGYVKTSVAAAQPPGSLNEPASILVIDVKNPKLDKAQQTVQILDDVLYELRELEELTQAQIEARKLAAADDERIEQVVDDSDENYDQSPDELTPNNVCSTTTSTTTTEQVKWRMRRGVGHKPILERRIPSFYGSDNRLVAEPLIIDDVRQSMMLDIDGITHVLKNEALTIDSESNDLSTGQKLKAAAANNSSADSLSSLSSSTNSSCSNNADNNNIQKINNRTVIVVEDQLINGMRNGTPKATPRTQPVALHASNESKSYEILKIDVRKSATTTNGEESISSLERNNSNEFLTSSERAQFERAEASSVKKLPKNNNYLVSGSFF
jgi:hypothetical protein